MKFDCGETRAEKIERLQEWHPWFAWHPVRIDSHHCRWLEIIERRGIHFYGEWSWQYRLLGVSDAEG